MMSEANITQMLERTCSFPAEIVRKPFKMMDFHYLLCKMAEKSPASLVCFNSELKNGLMSTNVRGIKQKIGKKRSGTQAKREERERAKQEEKEPPC